ncbi:MAG: M1 family metallopeptidase [Acidobacteriota bacterium]|nr:M1 family metallopeptidase [Acidobacteriota bacterium]
MTIRHRAARWSTAISAASSLLGASAAVAAAPVRPPVVEYRLTASLDTKTHVVSGSERLLWRNPSADSVGELRFHLYLNAFKNNRSTFQRESRGMLRGNRRGDKPEDWGAIDILSMKTAAGADLLPASKKVQPDGNDPSDETVLSVPLPVPVPPHGQIALDIAFRSKLPRIFARTGFVRDYHLVGQWFPKIGVYEPAGMRGRPSGGWNCHAFHANSEFYADYGDYDVTLSVPSGWTVGATGRLLSVTRRGAITEHRYSQENVHDFAWAADPRFAVHEFRFDPVRDVPAGWAARAAAELGTTPDAIALKPVAVRLLLQPDHLAARDRYVEGVRVGISFYGLWFGAYPYETLTLVDPPEDGLGSAGMEYPTFITGGALSPLLRWPFAKARETEDVAVHEFGHQYWYGIVGSNEFEEPWLDEGLNTDSEYRAMGLAYGARDFAELPGGIGFGGPSLAHAVYASSANTDPILRPAWGYASAGSYGLNSYMKVGLFLAQLRNDIGAQPFARAQRAFFEEWSFRHPATADFFDVFERVTGKDLSTYRRNIVEGTARLDWQVVSAVTRRAPADSGLFDRAGGRVTLDAGRPAGAKSGRDEAKAKRYETVVLFANTGDWPHDAAARLVFEDGRTVDRTLPAAARWVRLSIASSSPLAWAAADPDRRNPWDANRLNDSRVLGVGRGAAETRGRSAAAKYSGWAAALAGLVGEFLWFLA